MGLIEQAIANRAVLQFTYDGAIRFVEPHCLGRGAKGQLLLRGFQTGGDSDTLNFGWKLFTVDKITDLAIARPRHGFNAEDVAMKGGIIAALESE